MEQSISLQQRIDRTHESPLFYKIFALVAGGMFLDAADVYMASSVAGAVLKKWLVHDGTRIHVLI